jgi:hypothetical protein
LESSYCLVDSVAFRFQIGNDSLYIHSFTLSMGLITWLSTLYLTRSHLINTPILVSTFSTFAKFAGSAERDVSFTYL